MAPKKATAKSPKPKSTPARKAKPEAVKVPPDASPNHGDVLDQAAEEAQDDAGSGEDSGPEPEAVTPARTASKRKAAEEGEGEDRSPSAKKPKVSSSSVKVTRTVTESGGKKKHAHRHVEVEIPVSTTTPVTKPAGKHIVFNDKDDGPAEFFTPQEAPAQELLDAQLSGADEGREEDEEGSDSDDDAPEAVSSHAAAAQAAKSAQAATKAAEKQLELQKRKRQERDARFRQQAEARKKNQAVSDKKAAAAAAAEVAEASPEPAQQAPGRRDHLPSVSTAPTRKRLDRRSLPDVLPDSFFEAASDDESDQDDDDDDDDATRRPKKPKFDTVAKQLAKAESRRPQDQRVGSTVYRVAAPQEDPSLAPKLRKHSRNAKELLLRRQRPVARKGGFLVKKPR